MKLLLFHNLRSQKTRNRSKNESRLYNIDRILNIEVYIIRVPACKAQFIDSIFQKMIETHVQRGSPTKIRLLPRQITFIIVFIARTLCHSVLAIVKFVHVSRTISDALPSVTGINSLHAITISSWTSGTRSGRA